MIDIPGVARDLDVTSPLREGQSATATVNGACGDLVSLLAGPSTSVQYAPTLFGSDVLGAPPALVLFAGAADGAGMTSVALAFGSFASPTTEGAALYFQALAFDASLQPVLGSSRTVVLLDQSF